MTVSSRTPEGEPHHCPVCSADVCIEPSPLFGDATCPNCGSLLWFLNAGRQTLVFEHATSQDVRDRVVSTIAEQLGVDRDKLADDPCWVDHLGHDSLDTVELVMELEEEFDLP